MTETVPSLLLGTYTVSLAWSTAIPNGPPPTVTVARDPAAAAPGAPVASGPVDHRNGIAIARGAGVRRVDGLGRSVDIDARPGRPCPSRSGPAARIRWSVRPLHLAALITETLPPPRLATYSVRVAGLMAAATGNLPTLTVATGRPQPRVTRALHRAPFSTDTVLLVPLTT